MCENDEKSSFSPSVGLKTRHWVKEAQESSLFCPEDINRMRGSLGLLSSSKLPTQCWFNQSQMIGMGIPNCKEQSLFHDSDDEEEEEEEAEAEEHFAVGDVASFMGSQTMKARFPRTSKLADPGHHVTPSVESLMRLSVAITTLPSSTMSSFLSVCPNK